MEKIGYVKASIEEKKNWVKAVFLDHEMTEKMELKEPLWFIHDLGSTPSGGQPLPMPRHIYSVFQSNLKRNPTVEEYSDQLAKVMNDLEENLDKFKGAKTEKEQGLESISEIEKDYTEMAKKYASSLPRESIVTIKSNPFYCIEKGVYSLTAIVDGKESVIASGIEIGDTLATTQLKSPKEIVVPLSLKASQVHVVLKREDESVAAECQFGMLEYFDDLKINKSSPSQGFQLLEKEIELFTGEPEKKVVFGMLTVRMKYQFTPQIFKYYLEQKQIEIAHTIQSIDSNIDEILRSIAHITNDFPQIKFFTNSTCFYNEEKQIKDFNSKNPKADASEKKKTELKSGDDRDYCKSCFII